MNHGNSKQQLLDAYNTHTDFHSHQEGERERERERDSRRKNNNKKKTGKCREIK